MATSAPHVRECGWHEGDAGAEVMDLAERTLDSRLVPEAVPDLLISDVL
jgi:hypothetical protein